MELLSRTHSAIRSRESSFGADPALQRAVAWEGGPRSWRRARACPTGGPRAAPKDGKGQLLSLCDTRISGRYAIVRAGSNTNGPGLLPDVWASDRIAQEGF